MGFEEVSIKERMYAILHPSFHPGVWKVGVMASALAIILNQGRENTRTQGKLELEVGRNKSLTTPSSQLTSAIPFM